jgi:hypothetical protein
MKNSHKTKIFTPMFLFSVAFSFIALNGYAVKPALATTPTKIKGGKEILVARDIGGGSPFGVIEWCGNDALLINSDKFGKEWVDFNGNKVTVSTKETDHLIGCTPDGRWVLYADWDSAREYKDKRGRIPEDIVDEGPGWHGSVMDLYRHEIPTGIRQKFAVVRDDSGALVSPDGLKVLLGNRHDSAIEMPEPRWEQVWLTKEWLYGNTFWFADSSGVVTEIWGNGSSMGVEFFGENGWAKEFSLERSVCAGEAGCSVMVDAVDNEQRIYLSTGENFLVSERMSMTEYHFFLCKIENRGLFCEKTGDITEHKNRFAFVGILPDGDFIFNEYGDTCIQRIEQGQANAKCMADIMRGDNTYEEIHMIAVSPDRRRMAFMRGKTPPKPGGGFYAHQYDLFVKELSEDQ